MRDFLKRNKTTTNADWMLVETGYVVKYTGKNNTHLQNGV